MPDIVSSDSTINNPYSAGRPVKNSEMFFGRNDIFEAVLEKLKGQDRNNGIVLYGQSRIGKTSILYHMSRAVGANYFCILVDLHKFKLDSWDNFLWDLACDILSFLREDYQINGLPILDHDIFMKDSRRSFEDTFLQQLWPVIGDKHILLMIDEAAYLQEQNMQSDIQYMHHLMQHYKNLNFLFAFSNSLNEMTKFYASVFNPLFYIKISLLDQIETNNLITQPTRDFYHIDSPIQERIFSITSGHPYYTQLLCLCLFDRWKKRGAIIGEHIEIQHVEEVTNEAVSLGSMPLKQAWLESTLGEKAVMIGMASAMDRNNQPVSMEGINKPWQTFCSLKISPNEMMPAINRLLERDIIVGQDQYKFTVDYQRIWIQKNNSLEIVRSEIQEQERHEKEQMKRDVLSGVTTLKFHIIFLPAEDTVEPLPLSLPSTVEVDKSDKPKESIKVFPHFLSRRQLIISGMVAGLAVAGGVAWAGLTSLIDHNPVSSQFDRLPIGGTLQRYSDHTATVYSVTWSSDGKYIASGSSDKTIKVRDVFTHLSTSTVITFYNHSHTVNAVAWSPNGKYIVSGSDDNTVSIWEAFSGHKIRTYTGHTDNVYTVSWSPNSTFVVSGSADTTIRIWDTTSAENKSKVYLGQRDIVYSVAWAPNNQRIASGGADKTIEVWDPASEMIYLAYQGHATSIYSIAWSPQSTYIVTGGGDTIVKVWDTASGHEALSCKGHKGSIYTVAWSPDGKYIASGSDDMTIKVWNISSGHEYLTYKGHADTVTSIAWSPNSKMIVSGSADMTVQIWKVSN